MYRPGALRVARLGDRRAETGSRDPASNIPRLSHPPAMVWEVPLSRSGRRTTRHRQRRLDYPPQEANGLFQARRRVAREAQAEAMPGVPALLACEHFTWREG